MAIQADACQQRAEHPDTEQTDDHGERVEWNDGNGPDVVCPCCGSGWGIDQSRLEEPSVSDDDLADALDDYEESPAALSLSERWPSADAAVSSGESTVHAKVREKITNWLEGRPDANPSVPRLLGDLRIDPRHAEFVADVLDGNEPATESFTRPTDATEWHLEAIVDADGEEHEPVGDGVDMVELHLPVRHLLQETRLQHSLKSGEVFRCGNCNVAVHQPEWMARHLAEEYGLHDSESADSVLIVEDYHDQQRECMERSSDFTR